MFFNCNKILKLDTNVEMEKCLPNLYHPRMAVAQRAIVNRCNYYRLNLLKLPEEIMDPLEDIESDASSDDSALQGVSCFEASFL